MKFSDCCKKCDNRHKWKHKSFINTKGDLCEQFCCMLKNVDLKNQSEKIVKRIEYLKHLSSSQQDDLCVFNRVYTDKKRFLEDIDKFKPDYILSECPMQIELSLILFEKK